MTSPPHTTIASAAPTQGSRGVGGYGPVGLERYDEKTGEVVERVEFEGRIIGSATSEHDKHYGHPGTAYAPKRIKCSACRWLEVTLYLRRTVTDQPSHDALRYRYDYVIYTLGASNVPHEIDFIRLHQTDSAFEVVELLTVRRTKRNAATGESFTDAFLPPQHARALAQAATIDEDIREAYVNRAVA